MVRIVKQKCQIEYFTFTKEGGIVVGWMGKFVGGFFGGLPGAIIGDVIQDASNRTKEGRFAERQVNRDNTVGSGHFTLTQKALAFDVWIEIQGTPISSLFHSGTRVPCEVTRELHTSETCPLLIDFRVLEGKSTSSEDVAVVGKFRIGWLSSTSEQASVLIAFTINRQGQLLVAAKEGRKQHLQIVRCRVD